jgi:hypothetical protein
MVSEFFQNNHKIGFSESFVITNSGKMIIDPYMQELPELFKSFFVQILHVGYLVPRLEYYLTKGINIKKPAQPFVETTWPNKNKIIKFMS